MYILRSSGLKYNHTLQLQLIKDRAEDCIIKFVMNQRKHFLLIFKASKTIFLHSYKSLNNMKGILK